MSTENTNPKGAVPGVWAARCECYNDHNSASGRCNNRDVTDPQARPGEAVLCERCRKECAR